MKSGLAICTFDKFKYGVNMWQGGGIGLEKGLLFDSYGLIRKNSFFCFPIPDIPNGIKNLSSPLLHNAVNVLPSHTIY